MLGPNGITGAEGASSTCAARAKAEAGRGVIFRNIRIEDPRPTLQQFFLCMTVPKPYSKDQEKGEKEISPAFTFPKHLHRRAERPR